MLYTADVADRFRLRRSITVLSPEQHASPHNASAYWQSRPPDERVAAVEFLRKQMHGSGARLQRVLRVTERSRR